MNTDFECVFIGVHRCPIGGKKVFLRDLRVSIVFSSTEACMDEAAIAKYISDTFDGVAVVEASGDLFFFYDPESNPADRKMPFVTLVTGDRYETVSKLDRAGVFRLNIGVDLATYRAIFGQPPEFRADGGAVETGHDFSALDVIMPHPVYAAMGWVCVLNPEAVTFDAVKGLLAKAYQVAAGKAVK